MADDLTTSEDVEAPLYDENGDSPPNAQQTGEPGVIAGESAAEASANRNPDGTHTHDLIVGEEHVGPIVVPSTDPTTDATEELQ